MASMPSERLLFINPPSPDGRVVIRDTNRSGRISSEGTIWPQVGLAMLASVFVDDDVKIVDCIAERIGYLRIFEIMKEFRPSWVIFNPISSTFTHDTIISCYAKSINANTVAISPAIQGMTKEELHDRFPTIDHTLDYKKGGLEPEYQLYRLVRGNGFESRKFEDLPPARQDLLPIGKYRLPFIGSNYTFIIQSRGCPWKCIYCRQGATWKNRVRYRSVESVVEELRRYGIKNFAFHSDTFTLSKEWVMDFCRQAPMGVKWICNSRVDTVDLEMLRAMKKAGCWMICYGIESGNNEVLAKNKKGATCEQAIRAISLTRAAGIKSWGYFMLGLFGDTIETMEQTIQFALRLPLAIANFSISAPYPGTKWHEIAKSRSWLRADDLESYDQNYSAICDQPRCHSSIVKRYQKRAYRRWYLSRRGFSFLWEAIKSPRFFLDLIKNNL